MSNRSRVLASAALILSQLLPAIPAGAATFTDVTSSHIYAGEIETLAARGIVRGNPDNSFKPDKTVNRAELLIMLYRAAGKTPATPTKACFTDSGMAEWFSPYVCDAAGNGYVGGYLDGHFRPGQEVNRVEALKMIHTVLGLVVNPDHSFDPLRSFSDVSLTAWYAPYMASAFAHGILPIAGQEGSRFYPDRPLARGEAAAYIFNALGLEISSAGSSSSDSESSTGRRSSASSRSSESNAIPAIDVDFPFGDDGNFTGKKSKVYVFRVQQPVIAWMQAELAAGNEDKSVQCRLYKLEDETSFSFEYYIGQVVGDRCSIRVALGNGDYQFEVTPRGGDDMGYRVETRAVTGDGNDGFREASILEKGKPKTGNLEVDDYAEWYTFKVTRPGTYSVELSNAGNLKCLIYPMADVDLYGFSGPVCNEEYELPVGTYYVGVIKRDHREASDSFTVRFE